jgi:hypothetical protein
MKKIFYYAMAAALVCGCVGEEDEGTKTGAISGIVTDFATGEPIKAAAMTVVHEDYSDEYAIESTLTGSDGYYEFLNVPAGQHYIVAEKAGYNNNYYPVLVTDSKTTRADIQIRKK